MGLLVLVSSTAFGDASYSVPVPTDAAAQATFDLPSALWTRTEDGAQHLNYDIPGDLVGGKTINIELSGKPPVLSEGLSTFKGELASGACTFASETKVLCLVQYQLKTFGPDPDVFARQSREYLEQKYAGSLELPAKLKTQAIFKNEPAGVVNLEIR
jgi:hypothetical protein